MRLPKNFQPVGVSKNCTPSLSATLSSAPLVGMLRATPCAPSSAGALRQRARQQHWTCELHQGVAGQTQAARPRVQNSSRRVC